MTQPSSSTQPSFTSRFAADAALQQSKLISEGSFLGSIAQHYPSYAQLQG